MHILEALWLIAFIIAWGVGARKGRPVLGFFLGLFGLIGLVGICAIPARHHRQIGR